MKLFIRVNLIGISVFGFTVAVALLVFNNQFFDFLGVTISENYTFVMIFYNVGVAHVHACCRVRLRFERALNNEQARAGFPSPSRSNKG